jgi:hypothetical protein
MDATCYASWHQLLTVECCSAPGLPVVSESLMACMLPRIVTVATMSKVGKTYTVNIHLQSVNFSTILG